MFKQASELLSVLWVNKLHFFLKLSNKKFEKIILIITKNYPLTIHINKINHQ